MNLNYIIKRAIKHIRSQYSGNNSLLIAYRIILHLIAMVIDWLLHNKYALKISRKDEFENEKKCIFTVLVGDYDNLKEPEVITPGWDYICITDNPALSSQNWSIILVENKKNLDMVRFSREYKILNHLVDSNYDISIYIDANVRILGNLNQFLNISFNKKIDLAILYHPYHLGIKDEFEACLRRQLDNEEVIKRQQKKYEKENYRDHLNQVNNRLIIRRCNNLKVKYLMEDWWDEVNNFSFRDQLSFNPTLSKHPEINFKQIEFWKFKSFFHKYAHKQ